MALTARVPISLSFTFIARRNVVKRRRKVEAKRIRFIVQNSLGWRGFHVDTRARARAHRGHFINLAENGHESAGVTRDTKENQFKHLRN